MMKYKKIIGYGLKSKVSKIKVQFIPGLNRQATVYNKI